MAGARIIENKKELTKEQKREERRKRMDALKKDNPTVWAYELSWREYQELKPSVSWKDFCAHKVEASREYWKMRSAKPPKGELSDEQIDERMKKLEAQLQKLKAKRKK